MVLVMGVAGRRDWRRNTASTWNFGLGGPRNCRDLFRPGCRYHVGTRCYSALRRGVLSVLWFRFAFFSAGRSCHLIPFAVSVHRAGCRLRCHKLAHDGRLDCRQGLEHDPGNARRVEGVSGKRVAALRTATENAVHAFVTFFQKARCE